MNSPEQAALPHSLEGVWHALRTYNTESSDYKLALAKRSVAESILANCNDEDVRERALGMLAMIPDEHEITEERTRSELAEQRVRADLRLAEDVNVDALFGIVQSLHISGNNEDSVVSRGLVVGSSLPDTFVALRELARLRNRSYTADANLFATTYVTIDSSTDVYALLDQGYGQDLETLLFAQNDPSFDSSVSPSTRADIDAQYGYAPPASS